MPNSEQKIIGNMFNQIADTYDAVNRLLSFRKDLQWRKKVSQSIPNNPDLTLLDIATGTGELLIDICMRCPQVINAVGIDIADNMLLHADAKIKRLGLLNRARVMNADATELPFFAQSFDVVTIAFGIRNVVLIESALKEIERTLKPNGVLIVLEFSLPTNWLFRMIYLVYFRHILPFIGGLISRHKSAYRYLNRTVEGFLSVKDFSQLLLQCGFKSVDVTPLSFGIATIYCARKESGHFRT
jgi:demethylmenaquinone methyltransferase/2-methoxy-6-polyprenyl-1,4-benzoquinol methylase